MSISTSQVTPSQSLASPAASSNAPLIAAPLSPSLSGTPVVKTSLKFQIMSNRGRRPSVTFDNAGISQTESPLKSLHEIDDQKSSHSGSSGSGGSGLSIHARFRSFATSRDSHSLSPTLQRLRIARMVPRQAVARFPACLTFPPLILGRRFGKTGRRFFRLRRLPSIW